MQNEQEILDKISSGIPRVRSKALKEICDSCFPKIESYILLRGGDNHVAQDIFQDAVSIFYKNLMEHKFRGESSIETYLFGICKNLWFQEIKRKKKERDEKNSLMTDDLYEENPTIKIDLLESVMNELKDDCQKVLALFYYHKKSIGDIRLVLGMNSDQVVKNKKARCLKYLMNIIKQRKMRKESFFNE